MSEKHLSVEELIAQDVGARSPKGLMAKASAGLALLTSSSSACACAGACFSSGLPRRCRLYSAWAFLTAPNSALFT